MSRELIAVYIAEIMTLRLLYYNDRTATLHIKYVGFRHYQRYYLETGKISDKYGRCYLYMDNALII